MSKPKEFYVYATLSTVVEAPTKEEAILTANNFWADLPDIGEITVEEIKDE